MKAIKILKAILEEDERLAKDNGVSLTCEYCKLMNEAIEELENISGSKQSVDNHTCKGCKHEEIKNDLDPLCVLPDYCRGCSRCSIDRWEGKE